MNAIRVLVIDENELGRQSVASALEGEGWLVQGASSPEEALKRLLRDRWHLVVAHYSTSAASGPLFELLKDLAVTEGPVRVLFLVPSVVADCTRAHFDWHRVPYAVTPIRLTDFFDQVSGLLQDAGALRQPLRRIQAGDGLVRHPVPVPAVSDSGQAMFASRQGYFEYDEEELREFEEEEEKRKKKQEQEKIEII